MAAGNGSQVKERIFGDITAHIEGRRKSPKNERGFYFKMIYHHFLLKVYYFYFHFHLGYSC